ncbi:MAG: peptidylprolyl isomerase [Pirellulaceae bacterium]|nr:peptidylprolyl isomerase [Pirellulaceae bacterium]
MTSWICRSTLFVSLSLTVAALAQEAPKDPAKPPTTPPAAAPQPADPSKPAAAAFDKLLGEWKTLLKDLRALKLQYQSAPTAEQAKINDQWTALVTKGNGMLAQLEAEGVKAYLEAPNQDPQLSRFLVKLADDSLERDDYEAAARISQVLIDGQSSETKAYDVAAVAAYALSDFKKAAEYHKQAQDAGVVGPLWGQWGANTPEANPEEYAKLWEKEQELRAAEEKKDDLPRVKIKTSKGDIVVELFEDQAPETVGNFISLVEKGFYDGTPFHRVLKNFMAQGGDPKGDGTGGPGYEIFCECYKDNYRRHFRGSLSMAHSGRDTGGSQFFLTFRPTSHLNGKHTCFGRVIEGMDVLTKLQRIDPEAAAKPEADKILTAEVVRKREHPYAPRKVAN